VEFDIGSAADPGWRRLHCDFADVAMAIVRNGKDVHYTK
jgi:hypothetical protein